MGVIYTGPPIYVDSDGFLHLPGQPPVKYIETPNQGETGTQKMITHVVKTSTGVELTLAEITEPANA